MNGQAGVDVAASVGHAPVRRALISVSDKTGLEALGRRLAAAGVELVSTGGTARALRAAGLGVRDVAELTAFPEMLDGRVKTLHPMIHGGLLAQRANPGHEAALAEHGIAPIDLLVVNLYPFEATVSRGASPAECIETIDIGGPAMLRAAAKNHADVTVLIDPQDYEAVLSEIEATGGTAAATRRRLAAVAFGRTAAYDAAVAAWMNAAAGEATPRRRVLAGRLAEVLRYGENPHQDAAFYVDGTARHGVATAQQAQGKALSYNNIADTDAAMELAAEFRDAPAAVIVKHANPCGVAQGPTLAEAVARAQAADPVSAFGGIVAVNRPLDGPAAEAVARIFTEVVIAPGADEAARAVFAAKPNLRLLLTEAMPDPEAPRLQIVQVAGGFLVQDRDVGRVPPEAWRVVTRRAPEAGELADLAFAWTVVRHVKSNAIVLARGGATLGIGAGQMSRLDSVRIAVEKAGERAGGAAGASVASDAFFPFADAIEAALAAGATAIIQPGGSVRDAEAVAAADRAGAAMVFTGMRHFRH